MFDYDWTLVKPKANRKFPKDENDWQWYTDAVPYVLRKHYDDGYGIYVFTNQTKDWKKQHILNSLGSLNIPMTIVIAYNLAEHKPSPVMFKTVMEGKKWKPEGSFFAGDALGRKSDFADTDLGFARSIGVVARSPEELFVLDTDTNGDDVGWRNTGLEEALKKVVPSTKQEVVIMVGYPGSGKSTIAKNLEKQGYLVVDGDTYKTDEKRLAVGMEGLKKGSSVVFDATNLTRKKRALYVGLANSMKLPVRCVFVAVPLERALERNLKRPEEKRVPRVAYYKMQKTFEAPSEDEGFDLVRV